jgi:hypothetical protein
MERLERLLSEAMAVATEIEKRTGIPAIALSGRIKLAGEAIARIHDNFERETGASARDAGDSAQREPFTTERVDDVPRKDGVYVLWERLKPLFVGSTQGTQDDLHSALQRELAGREGLDARSVSHFSYEATQEGDGRQAAILNLLAHPKAPPAKA